VEVNKEVWPAQHHFVPLHTLFNLMLLSQAYFYSAYKELDTLFPYYLFTLGVTQCIGVDDLSEGETCSGFGGTRGGGSGSSRTRGGSHTRRSTRACGASINDAQVCGNGSE